MTAEEYVTRLLGIEPGDSQFGEACAQARRGEPVMAARETFVNSEHYCRTCGTNMIQCGDKYPNRPSHVDLLAAKCEAARRGVRLTLR